jgi:hypothetical protein
MNHEKICTWLGLPPGHWPPDHYALLGLKPGEGDVVRIDQHVQERLAKLRCYQLSHPDQATEAMNRLAQAFLCLTDPDAKNAYDRAAGINGVGGGARSQEVVKPGALDDTAVGPKTQVDWHGAPPPVRAQEDIPASSQTPILTEDQPPLPQSAQTTSPPPVSLPADAVYEAAYVSADARRGLGTIHGLVERVYHTRQLLWAWEQAGKVLNKPKRRLTGSANRTELTRRLEELSDLLADYPRILGQPGQPGYRVMAMARLEMTADMFNMLDPAQREALAADWRAGRVMLLNHRRFLRQELKSLRKQNWLSRSIRASRATLNDHPVSVLLAIGLAALGIALFYLL